MTNTSNGHSVGFFEGRILDVLTELWGDLPRFAGALIRGLDSQRDPSEISRAISRRGLAQIGLAAGAVLSPDVLRAANDVRFFNGFDELWFLPDLELAVAFVDPGIVLTTDTGPLQGAMRGPLFGALRTLNCPLALGDGCGLNCITTDRRFWDQISKSFKPMACE